MPVRTEKGHSDLSDEQLKINNSKAVVKECFAVVQKYEQHLDNAYVLLTLISNCTINLELNNLADLDQIMGAVNLGMRAAIEERAANGIRPTPKEQKFLI